MVSNVISIKLRKIDKTGVKHLYKLNKPDRLRRLAIDEGIQKEAKNDKKNIRKAAISKKARFNVLRIYRRYSDISACKKITRDMKYIDKKYLTGKSYTTNIC